MDSEFTVREKLFIEYLEYCLEGARAANDSKFMDRIRRALIAFKHDPDGTKAEYNGMDCN